MRLLIIMLVAAGCTPAPKHPALGPAAMSVQVAGHTYAMSNDGRVTLDTTAFATWDGRGFRDGSGGVIIALDDAGRLYGMGMTSHPHFASDAEMVSDNGKDQALTIADDGSVRLFSDGKQVGDPFRVLGMPASARRTAGMLVLVAMLHAMSQPPPQ